MGLFNASLKIFNNWVKDWTPSKENSIVISLGVPDTPPGVDLKKLFSDKKAKLITLDISDYEGADISHDLNFPIPDDLKNIADLIIDPGTVEHVFNCGQAMKNIHDMLVVGGSVFHHGPVNWVNHGYHNFSPIFYVEFYKQNNYRLVTPYVGKPDDVVGPWTYNPNHTLILPGHRYIQNIIAEGRPDQNCVFPKQERYQINWDKKIPSHQKK